MARRAQNNDSWAEQNESAAIENSAAGLPPLIGSDKQVAWAETLRHSVFYDIAQIDPLIRFARSEAHLAEVARNPAEREELSAQLKILIRERSIRRTDIERVFRDVFGAIGSVERFDAFLAVLRSQSKASWWIDNRDMSLARLVESLQKHIDEHENNRPPSDPVEAAMAEEAKAEALIKPMGEPASVVVAELRQVAQSIEIRFPEKREDFRQIVKGLGYGWADVCWKRNLGIMTGDPIDRLAETAHRLVSKGFLVRLHDEEARAKAIDGTFKPEVRRWITKSTKGSYEGWCCITWPKSDDLYQAARSLPGSRYKDGAVYVPPGAIEAVSEFAERYGFSMSPGTQAMLKAHREALAQGAVLTEIKDAPAPISADLSKRPVSLDAPADVDIDADLLDH